MDKILLSDRFRKKLSTSRQRYSRTLEAFSGLYEALRNDEKFQESYQKNWKDLIIVREELTEHIRDNLNYLQNNVELKKANFQRVMKNLNNIVKDIEERLKNLDHLVHRPVFKRLHEKLRSRAIKFHNEYIEFYKQVYELNTEYNQLLQTQK